MKSKIVMPVPLKGHDKKEELANNKNEKTVFWGEGILPLECPKKHLTIKKK